MLMISNFSSNHPLAERPWKAICIENWKDSFIYMLPEWGDTQSLIPSSLSHFKSAMFADGLKMSISLVFKNNMELFGGEKLLV